MWFKPYDGRRRRPSLVASLTEAASALYLPCLGQAAGGSQRVRRLAARPVGQTNAPAPAPVHSARARWPVRSPLPPPRGQRAHLAMSGSNRMGELARPSLAVSPEGPTRASLHVFVPTAAASRRVSRLLPAPGASDCVPVAVARWLPPPGFHRARGCSGSVRRPPGMPPPRPYWRPPRRASPDIRAPLPPLVGACC